MGSHPKLTMAESQPPLTPTPLQPWSHCIMIWVPHLSGGACWVCGLSTLHRAGPGGIGTGLLSRQGTALMTS